MPATRLTMRKIREVLRLKFDCPSIYPKMWERQFVSIHWQTSDSTLQWLSTTKVHPLRPIFVLSET